MSKIIEYNNVSFWQSDNLILENLSFTINKGDFLLIIGPNGGGKTSLIKLLLGLYKPNKGSINTFYNTENKEIVGYLPQHSTINNKFPMTLELMLNLAVDKSIDKDQQRNRIDNIISIASIEKYRKYKYNQLSGGIKQRSLLARAILNMPKLLILDEPTNNIDIEGKKKFCNILTQISTEITVIMISHELGFLPKRINKIMCLEKKAVLHDNISLIKTKISSDSSHNCLVENLININNQTKIYEHLLHK